MTIPTNIAQNYQGDPVDLETWLKAQFKEWEQSLKPKPGAFGLRRLPRDPYNPDRFLPTFKTDKHTYTILGEEGVGFERYTVFQKRSLQRAFARDFQSIWNEHNELKMLIGGESNIGKLRSDAIIKITAIQDAVSDFSREQWEVSLWLCTLFILREDETVTKYDLKIAEEKMEDWAAYGYSELDFFLLSGSMVPGYGKAYNETMQRNQQARNRFLDATAILGRPEGEKEAENL